MTDPVLRAFREAEYPERDGVFLNTASYGLLPLRSVEAVTSLTRRRNRAFGVPDAEPGAALRRARAAAATLLDVDVEGVSLVPNTSFGVNLAAALVGGGPPGTVVVSAGEFPAAVLPWLPLRDRGFRVLVVPTRDGLPDEASLREAVASAGDVRALSVSAVQFASGYRADLGALGRACREVGAVFAVDAIQALGAVPLHPEREGIDVLATGGQKWLCAHWGSGFAWIAPRLRPSVPPPVVSWLAVEGGASFSARSGYRLEWVDDGRRFEPATLGVQDHLGLAVSVEALLELGIPRVRDHLLALHEPVLAWAAGTDRVRAITPEDPARRAGILALEVPDPGAALRALEGAGIRAAVREGWLRLAPHFCVEPAEMERVVDVLDGVVGLG